ncbi:MAG: hypothetical protein H0T76_04045 [Nannocystis sp.]|nr:hypothetical protein [Nannocystis sp.]MBA3545632.1 hypothetical protein [Nannocystis sp.]
MSKLTELLSRIRKLPRRTDDDGETLRVRMAPPASATARYALREACGGELPADLAELLAVTSGIELGSLVFRPEPEHCFGRDRAFLRASHYGNGDGLAIEPCGQVTRVWWVGHDSWFLVYWAASLEAFLELYLERAKRSFDEPWQPYRESVEVDVQAEEDAELLGFARTLPGAAIVHDLRRAAPGTEVPLECLRALGPDGEVRRKGLLLGFVRDATSPPAPPDQRLVGPPVLAFSSAIAVAKEWAASVGERAIIEVAVASAGGPGRGIYVELGGPAYASGLLVAETVSVGEAPAMREAAFVEQGTVVRAELTDVVLKAALAVDPDAKRPRAMPTIVVRIGIRGARPGANLLTVRVGPMGADGGRGSALQGKRIVTR